MQDTEYLYFGIWASEPKNPTGDHAFRWIAGGGGTRTVGGGGTVTITNITNFNALTGTATFNGGAVGKYVLRNQVGQADRIGTFTAKATFTADFGGTIPRWADYRIPGRWQHLWPVGVSTWVAAQQRLPPLPTRVWLPALPWQPRLDRRRHATGDWAATLHGSNNPGYMDIGDGQGQVECPVSAGCSAADLAGVAGWFDAFSKGDAAPNATTRHCRRLCGCPVTPRAAFGRPFQFPA